MTFPDWYQARHGYLPFPWQAALAGRIANGDMPSALTPPTSSGKTGVIDVWLWARLTGCDIGRRLVYVIDRRVVVDGVLDYAERLAETLPEAERPAIVQLRGGITIDNDWVLNPERPTLIISTVDQAGSRLLFQGYGVSERAASIHAGLLGNDALWVLDEVHLAQPLLQTLGTTRDLGADICILPMSATWKGGNTHGLTGADYAVPTLAARLTHPKPATLVKLSGEEDLEMELAKQARRLRAAGSEVVAVVCNRVATARNVHTLLSLEGESVLLTGRIRPADKNALLAEYLPRLEAGSRAEGRVPLFVVATQTIEVGADLDFDGLVSECAPLSALRQRAGRLNRLGELATAPMVVVYQPRKDDRVYAKGAALAWKWLTKVGTRNDLDFAPQSLGTLMAATPPQEEDAPRTPLLLRSHLEVLASDTARPDLTPWLHGFEHGSPEVFLCWRADWGVESVEAAPPRRDELLAVPLWAAKQWSAEIADTEGAGGERGYRKALTVLRWDGEQAEAVALQYARAGDTLVLPCSAGGCDRYGWAPNSTAPVCDVGDDHRRVRLHPAVYPDLADDIAALLGAEDTTAKDWRQLAARVGLGAPWQVLPVPDGVVVLDRGHWDSLRAYRAVSLADHCRDVGAEAKRLGLALGCAHTDVLRDAGLKHDAGKADPRWQAMVGATPGDPLAKGPGGGNPWLSLPPGWRHELASVARLPESTGDLARYLVGTHHGHGHPLFPAAPETDLWRATGDWAGMRARLLRTHGHWGLALLEAVVRLADWRVSEAEQASVGPAPSAAVQTPGNRI